MNSNRPYLIRAMYEWIIDNHQVPQVIVDATYAQVLMPPDLDKDGQVILNLSSEATHNLELGNDLISFSTRFSGKSEEVLFPPDAVIGIFARDTAQGMMFEPVESTGDVADSVQTKPNLTLVGKTKNKR